MRASREPSKLSGWQNKAGAKAKVGNFQEAAQFGDIIVLAVKGDAAESAVKLCGAEALNGKTVIDATNPIAPAPPEQGVLRFFTYLNSSFMENRILLNDPNTMLADISEQYGVHRTTIYRALKYDLDAGQSRSS